MSDMETDSNSESEQLNKNDEGEWEDWTEEEGVNEDATRSLFDDTVHPSVEAAVQYDTKTHSFDIIQLRKQLRLDDFGTIKCINYIRSEVQHGRSPLPQLKQLTAGQPLPFSSDKYMLPVLADDPLVMYEFEELEEPGSSAGPEGAAEGAAPAVAVEVQRLRDENAALHDALQALALATLPPELHTELRAGHAGGAAEEDQPGTSAAAAAGSQQEQRAARQQAASAEAQQVDDAYFYSYSGLGIHRDMLSDAARTEAYMRALEENPALIKGKRVLDVGCGTSILSMFAARGGAARVVGVDGSKDIAALATQNVKANNLHTSQGGPVSIVQGKMEQLQELDGLQQVDVIVSEWMGYALLFETMLDTVLYARDRFLAPGGAVLPDTATIYVAGGAAGATGLTFWDNVYGFSMAPVKEHAARDILKRTLVTGVRPSDIITPSVVVKQLDLASMRPEEQDFSADFSLVLGGPGGRGSSQQCCALVVWFDTDFTSRFCKEHPVKLSTAPSAPITHWAQTVLTLPEPITLLAEGAEAPAGQRAAREVQGRISMTRGKKHRLLDIVVEYSAKCTDGSSMQHTAMYTMQVNSGDE